MNLKLYSLTAQNALKSSQKNARVLKHQAVEPEHLLKGLLSDPSVLEALAKKEMVAEEISEELSKILNEFQQNPDGGNFLSPRYLKVTATAESLAVETGGSVTELHLLAAIASPKLNLGEVNELLEGFTLDNFKQDAIIPNDTSSDLETSLGKYTIDLVQKARNGELDVVIGRDLETSRIIQILSRRRKNNPVLMGAPGVGKNAIIEGLAHRIAKGDVPSVLKNKKLLTLDIGALIAGASLRGQFEERMKGVLKEVKESKGTIILFVDEIHAMVGAGGDGASNASNLLKPALARGEVQLLGATTPDEYRNSIEKDKALERRFQSILVEEPTTEECLAILRGIKQKYEVYHGVRITDPSLVSAISFSQRYLSNRSLPDKAIDLVDEAASRLRIEIESMPREVDSAERALGNAKMELSSIENQTDPESKFHKRDLKKKISNLEDNYNSLKKRWESELEVVQSIRSLKEGIQKTESGLEQAERDNNFSLGGDLKFGALIRLEGELNKKVLLLKVLQEKGALLNEEVTSSDIASVVEMITGVKTQNMLESEKDKLIQMESRIGTRVIGQKEALGAVSKSIRRSRAGLNDPNRPVGSFFFLGPSGTGKCLGPDVEVLCYDGSIVKAKDVETGMSLMGPDSKPRKVLSTTTGHGPMFRMSPVKGASWECNDVHILTLRKSGTDEMKDVSLNEYLKWSESEKNLWKQFSVGVDFAKQAPSAVSPYLLGVFVGGDSERIGNKIISNEIHKSEISKNCQNILTSSREERLNFLAGVWDGNGRLNDLRNIEVIQKNEDFAKSIIFVSRSLGFKVIKSGHHKVCIDGDITIIPTRLERQTKLIRKQIKEVCNTGFKTTALGDGDYAGFTLDRDGRFLLGDFTVTHNTELSKALTEYLFDSEENLIRLDMSEFMEKSSVARLIGSPPGYVGSDQGGQLTEAVRMKPYSVILFDEVEKGHPDVFNILLQLLDDGRLTDSQSRLVDFKNTVIIMTSNVGSKHLLKSNAETGVIPEDSKKMAMAELQAKFRPEFLGRIDEIIMFHGLTRGNINDIAEIQFNKLRKMLANKKLKMQLNSESQRFVIDQGFEPAYGARPLKRAIQKYLQDPLSMAILDGSFKEGDIIDVTFDSVEEKLEFKAANNPVEKLP